MKNIFKKMIQLALPCCYGIMLMLFLVSCFLISPETVTPPVNTEKPSVKTPGKIIVVSIGSGLDKFANDIKESLKTAFTQYPNTYRFSVIQQGDQIETLATAKDIRFGGNVDALNELVHINEYYEGQINSKFA